MPTVTAIFTVAVKSLALRPRATVRVDQAGIAGDRRFHLVDGAGRLVTQRQRPPLAVVFADYDSDSGCLTFSLPEEEKISGPVELGESVRTAVWGRQVPGRVVDGPWNEVLSRYCGGPVRLVMADSEGLCYDEYPLSILSQPSIDLLGRLTEGIKDDFDARRFRPNILIGDCSPHEEDTWIGQVVSVGSEVLLRVVALDPRCAITTVDPDTGRRDFDTPRLLSAYRPARRAPYFGVYATVESPGLVSIGDNIQLNSPPVLG